MAKFSLISYFLHTIFVITIHVITSGAVDLPPRLEVIEQDNSSIAKDIIDEEGCTVITLGVLEKRVLTSPGYPGKYSNNLQLCWKIICEIPTIRIGVKVDDVSIEDFFDVLRFDDGVTGQSIANVTSLSSEFQYFAVGNKVSVRFRSDGSNSGTRGFRLECSAVYLVTNPFSMERTTSRVKHLVANASEQFLMSPDFPGGYPSDLDLRWRIVTLETGKIIRVTFLHFRTDDTELPLDSIDIYDGKDDSSPLIAHMFYDNSKLLTFFSSGPNVFVRFRTNPHKWNFLYDTGFSLVYQTVDDNRACSIGEGIALTPSAPIAKLNVPPNYSKSAELLDCVWKVKTLAPSPNKITVRFDRRDDNSREEGEKLFVTYGGDDVTVHLGMDESWSRDFSSDTLTLAYKQHNVKKIGETNPVIISCELGWNGGSFNSSSFLLFLTLMLFAVLFISW